MSDGNKAKSDRGSHPMPYSSFHLPLFRHMHLHAYMHTSHILHTLYTHVDTPYSPCPSPPQHFQLTWISCLGIFRHAGPIHSMLLTCVSLTLGGGGLGRSLYVALAVFFSSKRVVLFICLLFCVFLPSSKTYTGSHSLHLQSQELALRNRALS